MKSHRGSLVFGLVVGLLVATWSYRWVVDYNERSTRAAEEEAVVQAARTVLQAVVDAGELEIVDPLAPDRSVGKSYIYPEGPGWAVSGYYRRDDADRWHPFLLSLTEAREFYHLKVQDEALSERAAVDPGIEIS
jgi:hypothetical protein